MLIFLLAVAAMGFQGNVIGSFHHGQWRGECFRDGTLAGMEDELCRARWTGNMDVSFERDADRLTLTVSINGDDEERCSAGMTFPTTSLAKRTRDAALMDAIKAGAREVARRCRRHTTLEVMNSKDVRATLRETDDLTHIHH